MINYKLKAERVRKNVDQQRIADITGMAVQTYSKKECGKRDFTLQEVIEISKYFGFTPNEIYDIFFDSKVNAKSNLFGSTHCE